MNAIERIKSVGGKWVISIKTEFPRPSLDGETVVTVRDDIPDNVLQLIQDIAADWEEYVRNWGKVDIIKI